MDLYICNKCYCTRDKIEHPFKLTQCGHIFCYNCIKQVKSKCPQCKSEEIRFVSLTESLAPKLSKLFSPLSDVITSIKSLIAFQREQKNIILEYFYQIDGEYQMLKYRYANAVQKEKQITREYSNLKKYAESLRKKLMFMKINSTDRKIVYLKPCSLHQDITTQNNSGLSISNQICDTSTPLSKKLHRS